MGGGAGGWLATVRKVFKPASKDLRHAKKQRGGDELEASGEAAEVVSVVHFPAAETSPEFTNESIGTVVWLEREEEYHGGEVAGACRRRQHRRGVAAAREERAAAERIQAFYRGYLARRALAALRGLVRLQALVRGHQVRRQVHRTMRCMQALVRAQDRFRARRLAATSPYDDDGRLLFHHQHGGRRSSGHEVQQAPPRRSNVSHCVRADDGGMSLLRHGWAAAACAETIDDPTYAGSWHCWMDSSNQLHGAAETSYVTAAATASDNTVEMEEEEEAARTKKSPTRDLYPVRPSAIPGYMAATQSARAKARMAPPPRTHARTRAGSSDIISVGSELGLDRDP